MLLKDLIQKAKNKKSNNLTVVGESIEENKFVDKTKIIETLLTSNQEQRIIVVRPRRFGKTFFLHTIAEICQGKQQKDLFKDYAIGKGDYDWQYYPVIFLTFSELSLESIKECKDSLRVILNKIAINHDLKLTGENKIKQDFAFLIQDLSEKTNKRVVILIDEYDTPIVRSNESDHLQRKISNLVRDILETCKSQENFIKLVFVTGITTCCLTGMLSGPNNFSRKTYRDEFASVFGFTEDEIKNVFKSDLDRLKERLNEKNTEQITDVMSMLKDKYNGYYFSLNGSSVYNPWSVVKCFEELELRDYWYDSNQMTSHFIDNIVKNPHEYEIINKIPLDYTEKDLRMNKRDFKRVLLEVGYVTLDYKDKKNLKLNWPNNEVKNAFEQELIESLVNTSINFSIHGPKIHSNLHQGSVDKLIECFNTVLDLSHPSKRSEKLHQELMFNILTKLNLEPKNEVILNNRRRPDTVFTVKNIGYVFEYGLLREPSKTLNKNASSKTKQVKDRQYYKYFEEKQINVDKILIVAIILSNEQSLYYQMTECKKINGKYVFQLVKEKEIKVEPT